MRRSPRPTSSALSFGPPFGRGGPWRPLPSGTVKSILTSAMLASSLRQFRLPPSWRGEDDDMPPQYTKGQLRTARDRLIMVLGLLLHGRPALEGDPLGVIYSGGGIHVGPPRPRKRQRGSARGYDALADVVMEFSIQKGGAVDND